MLKFILALGLRAVSAAPTEDVITALPNVTFSTAAYSGYLNVTDTKALHYVYVES